MGPSAGRSLAPPRPAQGPPGHPWAVVKCLGGDREAGHGRRAGPRFRCSVDGSAWSSRAPLRSRGRGARSGGRRPAVPQDRAQSPARAWRQGGQPVRIQTAPPPPLLQAPKVFEPVFLQFEILGRTVGGKGARKTFLAS